LTHAFEGIVWHGAQPDGTFQMAKPQAPGLRMFHVILHVLALIAYGYGCVLAGVAEFMVLICILSCILSLFVAEQ
jgi:hypothetical protein